MTSEPRSEGLRHHAAIAAAIIALHLGFAVLLILSRPPARAKIIPVAIAIRTIPAPTIPRPVESAAPIDVGLAVPEIEIAEPVDRHAPDCDLLGLLGTALQADPASKAALAASANGPKRAIMLWNGGWPQQPEIAPLRHAVSAALGTARTDCFDEVLTGPRLVFVPVDGTIVTIAFGSGTWSWRDILSDVKP